MSELEKMIQDRVINLMKAYGKRRDVGDKFLIGIWQKALGGCSQDDLRIGFQNLISTRVKSGMPVPAEFFEALHKDLYDDALMAWNQLFQVLKAHPGRPVNFADTIFAESVRRLGGLNFLGSLTGNELNFQKKSFIDTYCALAKQGVEYSMLCEGTYDAKPIEMSSLATRRTLRKTEEAHDKSLKPHSLDCVLSIRTKPFFFGSGNTDFRG